MHSNLSTLALALGCILAGGLCILGAIDQVRKGVTWGATGRGRVFREQSPGYFWYLFWVRIILGPIALLGGVFALV